MSQNQILIIDDVEPMLEMMAELFSQRQDWRVAQAKNLWEARLEIDRRRPDVVLLDELLPGESSQDLLVELKDMKIPVILITSMENPEHPVSPLAHSREFKPSLENFEQDRARFENLLSGLFKS